MNIRIFSSIFNWLWQKFTRKIYPQISDAPVVAQCICFVNRVENDITKVGRAFHTVKQLNDLFVHCHDDAQQQGKRLPVRAIRLTAWLAVLIFPLLYK